MYLIKSSKNYRTLSAVCLLTFILFNYSCKKETSNPDNISKTGISSFNLTKDSIVTVPGTVSINQDTISITVAGTTNVYGLSTKIILEKGATISPASGVHEDFSRPVNYTVTFANGTQKTYVVVVKLDKLKNIVYIGADDQAFYALDARDGSLIWIKTGNKSFSYSNPVFSNGTLYTGNTDGTMYAFDAALGNYILLYTPGSPILPSPAIANHILYFGSDDNYIYAVDALSGVLKWKYHTGSIVDSSPAVVNGVVYIGSADGNLYALDAVTGGLKWAYNTNSLIVEASPVVSNGVVYIGSRSGYLYAIDAASGQLKWQYSANGISLEQSRPVIDNGIIYFASWYNTNNFHIAGSVYAISETTGTQLWHSLDNIGFTTGPTIADGHVFISGDDGNLYSLKSTDGSVNWKIQIYPNGAMSTVKGGTVYIGAGGTHNVYALDEATGAIKWKYNIPVALNTSKPYVIDANGN